MATTFSVLYLGTGPEIDTTEGNVLSENGSVLVGTSYGSAETPLAYNAQKTLSPISYSGGTTNMYDIDNTLSNDTFSIDGGPPQTYDGLAIYNATITYTDGTPPATITAVVIQDTNGNLYLAPESSANADHAAMTAAPIASLSLDSETTLTSARLLADRQDPNYVCYAPGTEILTERGAIPVENLSIGDLVVTIDHGLQPIRWIRCDIQPLDAIAKEEAPVLVKAGALGNGRPTQDLVVSAQHRILVGGHRQLTDRFDDEAFAPAKSLTSLRGIRHMVGKRQIEWFHFACDQHEVVFANGCLSESLLLGPMALSGLKRSERQALAEVFGFAPTPGLALNGPPARPTLTVGDVRQLSSNRSKDRRNPPRQCSEPDIRVDVANVHFVPLA